MAWSASKIFSSWQTDAWNKVSNGALGTDVPKVALFDNSITPSQSVASASSAYGAGVWASGGVSDASGWPAAGRPLASTASGFSSNIYTYSAANTSSANSSTTIAGAYGCLIYDDTLTTPVADQGICYNYFGGTQSVTAGTFTIVWNASGIIQITL